MRLLKRLGDDAHAEVEVEGARRRDLVELAVQIVGRRAGPDVENVIYGLGEHRAPVHVEDAERLGVRGQRAGADAEQEPALEHVIEHRGLGGDQHRMAVGQVGGPGAELDAPRFRHQAGDEDHARRDGLGGVGDVLADESLAEAEPVGQDERLAILLEGGHVVALQPMDRHGEESELHAALVARIGRRCQRTRRGSAYSPAWAKTDAYSSISRPVRW